MRQRGRIAALLGVTLVLSLPAPAHGAGDPVAHGSFNLKISRSFNAQLKRKGVTMKPKSFSISSGSIDPTTGDGSLTLKGKLTFKHGRKTVVYDSLTATLGSGGFVKNKKLKLFSLGSGNLSRNGFGAEIGGVRARFLKGAARNVRKKLGLRSLRAASAGKVAVSEQPKTVEVTGGDVHVVPDPNTTSGSGTLASKLAAHCVQGLSGVTGIAPAIKNPPILTPSFDFPVTGGTISPAGTDGTVNQAGGIQLVNARAGGVPSSCNSPVPVSLAAIQQTNFANNMFRNYISAQVVITGPAPPLGGDQGTRIGSNLNTSNATVSADPDAHSVTINGTAIRINGATALGLNQAFMQPMSTYDPTKEFVSGDIFGTVDLTVTTR